MSDTDNEDQDYLLEILTLASSDLKAILEDLTDAFEERFGAENSALFLHIQLLSQHLGKAISSGPLEMRDELIGEARTQEALILNFRDSASEDEFGLLDMPVKGNA